MPSGHTERSERLARTALLIAMALSATTILIGGRDLWFWVDEVDWLVGSDDFTLRSLLTPHASHLIALPRALYEGLPRIFGVDYLPFRIFAVACVLACAGELFVLVRRRVGGPPAAAAAILLLFFGSAQEIVVSPLGIPFTLSTAFGLGAFLAVERADLRGDIGAMLLLVLAILSHTFGAIVAIGVATYYATDRNRRREVWVGLVPIALWVVWWLWARQFDQGIASSGNILGVPFFVVDAAGAAVEAILGLAPLLEGHLNALFGVAAVAALAVRFVRGGAGPWLYAYVVTLLAFWVGLGLAQSDQREPTTPRYLFFAAIMVMLIAAESVRGTAVRGTVLSRRAKCIVTLIFFVAMAGNVGRLLRTMELESDRAAEVRAQIAVQQIEAARIAPGFKSADLGPPASDYQPATAGSLLDFEHEIGPLGYSIDELRNQSADVRRGADFVLVRGLAINAVEIPAKGGPKPVGCVLRRPATDGYTTFELEPGLSLVELARDTGAARADPGPRPLCRPRRRPDRRAAGGTRGRCAAARRRDRPAVDRQDYRDGPDLRGRRRALSSAIGETPARWRPPFSPTSTSTACSSGASRTARNTWRTSSASRPNGASPSPEPSATRLPEPCSCSTTTRIRAARPRRSWPATPMSPPDWSPPRGSNRGRWSQTAGFPPPATRDTDHALVRVPRGG